MYGIVVSTELLQVPLCYQTLNISLADIELRVFREVNGPAPLNQIKVFHMLISVRLTHTLSEFRLRSSAPERQ